MSHCSCKVVGDCPIKDLSKDGSCSTALCTADELREWLKRVISAQELMYWRERCEKAENTLRFVRQEIRDWKDPTPEDDG